MQVAICLAVVYGGCSIVMAREWQRKHDQQLLDLVHSTDLSALYLQVNLDSFGGQLPADVPVSWGQLGGNDSGGIYLGETDFDTSKPAIRVSIDKIKSPENLLHVMQHEMCLVATHDAVRKTGDDPHGLIWQDCMKRFQQP